MKRMLKRAVALILCLAISSLAVNVFAADEIEAGYKLTEKMAAADRAYCARSGGDSLQQEGDYSIWRSGSWVEFDVDIPAAGDYYVGIKIGGAQGDKIQHSVAVDGNIQIEQLTSADALTVTGGWGDVADLEELVIGTINFSAQGSHTVRIESVGGNAFYSDYMFLTYLGAPIETVSLTAGSADIMAGDSVSDGCDEITAEFSKNIIPDLTGSLSGKVSLADESGNEIGLFGEVNGKALKIMLAETLTEGKKYTISFIDVDDFLNADSVSNVSYTFNVEAGDGVATITDAEAAADGEAVLIKAKMLSSQNIGIKGRDYSIFINAVGAQKSETPAKTGKTGDDGIIEATYEMPYGSADGAYEVYIGGKFVADEALASFVYASASTKETIESSLNACETPEAVEAVLTDAQNAMFIGIDPQTELGSLVKAEVYTHFLEGKVKFDDIKTEFRKYIAVENFRQASSVLRLRQQINNENNWINMGLEKAKYNLIPSEQVNAVINEIRDITETNADAYIKQIDSIINSRLLQKYNKTALTPALEDISLYVNQGMTIPIAFSETVSDISSIEFTLTVSEKSLLNLAEMALLTAGNLSYEINDNVIHGSITFDSTCNENNIGAINLTAPAAVGTYTIEVEGTVSYAPSDIDYILYADINEGQMTITTSQKPSASPPAASKKPAAGGGRGGSSGGVATIIPPVSSAPDTSQKEPFSFSDVTKEHWAYEAVDYLLKNGILSETSDRLYNPDKKIPREEIVKMMVMAFGLKDENAVCSLSDVKRESPYYVYIASAEKYGIIYGNDSGQFMIGQPVTREDACVILHRAAEKVYNFKGSDELFADDSSISGYAKEAVYDMKAEGIIEGVGENIFMPKGDVTYAQTAKMIYAIIKVVER